MELVKIGKYIAGKRKALGLTQAQVAEQLGMSSKSVSKWERGVCLPDVSVYEPLCSILGISLNEFLSGEDIVREDLPKKSEENLIQITADGKHRSRRLKAVILGLSLLIGAALLAGLLYFLGTLGSRIEPVPRDSTEMQTAELLSGLDGAFLYRFRLGEEIPGIQLTLTTYRDGTMVSRENLGGVEFQLSDQNQGILAVIPDFDNFRVRVILSSSGAKYQTEFPILEGVPNRKYYGRSACRIEESVSLSPDQEVGLLVLHYGENSLSAIPLCLFPDDVPPCEGQYMYYLSLRFGDLHN